MENVIELVEDKRAGFVHSLQTESVLLVEQLAALGIHVHVVGVEAEVGRLPGKDDAVCGSTNQNEFSQLGEVLFVLLLFVVINLVVQHRQESVLLQVHLVFVGVVPVVADGQLLTSLVVAQCEQSFHLEVRHVEVDFLGQLGKTKFAGFCKKIKMLEDLH